MTRVRILCLMMALCILLGVGVTASETDCDRVYCFTGQEFDQSEDALAGICITQLPDASAGTVLLGTRVLRPGDILTAQQLSQLTFQPLRREEDAQAVMYYLPIYEDRVEKTAAMTISIRGKVDNAPVAQDFTIETYKNLPNTGTLKVSDPEGQTLTYTVVRSPKRGAVEVNTDGTFTYTPKKNKVGVDSFTYTATDPAGNVSRVATVTIQILKPNDSRQYADTAGLDCRFEAEWLRNSGLFVGEQISGNSCFYPEKTMSREEFLTMLIKVLDIPTDGSAQAELPASTPQWLKPYLAAAQRSGLMANLPNTDTLSDPITGAEVAVMVQNALDLSVSAQALSDPYYNEEDVPTWAYSSLTVMAENGVLLDANAPMTRADAAKVLYRIYQIAPEAPGMSVFRMQK